MNSIVFFSNLELWSISENQGGRAQISTIRKFISGGWRVFYISSTGMVPDEIRSNVTVIETNYDFLTKISFSKFKPLHLFKYVKHFFMYNFFLRQGKKLIKDIGTHNIILYAYEVDTVLPVQKLAKKYSIPYVARFQGTVCAKTPDTLSSRVRLYPHIQALKATADMVIMTDDGTQGLQTLKRLGNKSRIIHFWRNGVATINYTDGDIRAFQEKNGLDNKIIFITLSRLVNWKRVDRAINAFSSVVNVLPKSELHIIGDGEEKNKLEKLANDLGIANRVVFHGAVNQSDVFLYLLSSSVFLSLYDLSNVGNPLLEAMRAGLPIITLDNGDTSKIIKNRYNGILIPESNIDDIPQMMIDLATNDDLAKKLGANALAYANEYFWTWEERMGKEFIEVSKLIIK